MKTLSFSLKKYNSAMARLLGEIKTGLDQTDPILGKIQSHAVVHGGKMRQVSEPKVVETKMQVHKADVVIDLDLYRRTDVEAFASHFLDIWVKFVKQTHKYFFEFLNQTTKAVGNVTDAKGKNVWDAQIEMLEGLKMRFDEDGNHQTEFIMHPDTAKKLAENPPTPEQQKRWEDALNKKREEYYAQKRTRRLS